MKIAYQTEDDTNVVGDTLEAMVKEGARRMLAAALEEKVSIFWAESATREGEEFHGYRNKRLICGGALARTAQRLS